MHKFVKIASGIDEINEAKQTCLMYHASKPHLTRVKHVGPSTTRPVHEARVVKIFEVTDFNFVQWKYSKCVWQWILSNENTYFYFCVFSLDNVKNRCSWCALPRALTCFVSRDTSPIIFSGEWVEGNVGRYVCTQEVSQGLNIQCIRIMLTLIDACGPVGACDKYVSCAYQWLKLYNYFPGCYQGLACWFHINPLAVVWQRSLQLTNLLTHVQTVRSIKSGVWWNPETIDFWTSFTVHIKLTSQ